jgi:hypothetical protein
MERVAMMPGAGEARQQRDERAPGQPHRAHEAVQQERGARQVARFLQRQDEQEQDQDLRQEHHHAAHAGDQPLGEQPAQRPLGHVGVEPLRAGGRGALDPAHGHLGPAEDGLEHEEQRHRQKQRAPQRVQHHGVDAVVALQAHLGLAHGQSHDAAHLLMQLLHALGPIVLQRVERGPGLRLHCRRCNGDGLRRVQPLQQLARAVQAHAHRADHGHAQLARQHRAVDLDALALRHVAHVQHQHHGQAQGARLQHQAQVQAQVGSVGHADQQLGHGLARAAAGNHVARHRLVQALGMQAVGARQVQHAHAAPARRGQVALLALDGHAGIVGHLLARAGQQVEQRRLAAVGVAQQGHMQRLRAHAPAPAASTRTRTSAASCRRSANVAWPTRTASGSADGKPLAITRTGSPGRKPISISRSTMARTLSCPPSARPATVAGTPLGKASRPMACELAAPSRG